MKKSKGLADTQDGEFILNESGTSVSTDSAEPEAPDFDNEELDNDKSAKANEPAPTDKS